VEYVALGKTGLMVSRTAFGALPIQRIESREEAASLVLSAWEAGINFFDTARSYSDSEAKLSLAFSEIRSDVLIATKSATRTGVELQKDLETSLLELQTDYIDLYQLHNPSFLPVPDGADGIYNALLAAKRSGLIRSFGITNHSIAIAREAVTSALYDCLQYPFSLLSDEQDIQLMNDCVASGMGFIAMKALAGGLLTHIPAAFSWIRQFEEVVPVWGIQRKVELDELLSLEANPPVFDKDMQDVVESERAQLSGSFCRGCGYCLPCPVGIPINNANRMKQLLRRSPVSQWLTDEWQELMSRIEDCTHCGACAQRCPCGLKPYETLPDHLRDYKTFL